MLTTAAVLAIQQLSEVSDSLPRYRRLSVLGTSNESIFRSLRIQTLVYFLAPFGVAVCHSVYALYIFNKGLYSILGVDITTFGAITGAMMVVIYGAYILVSYVTSKGMVKGVIK